MNVKHYIAGAAVVSVLALAAPVRAQVLGGGLSGAVGGTLSGGVNGIGGIDAADTTSAATSTVRDANRIGRATTQHAHDTVSATADAADRAAANADTQVKSADAAVDATANAASRVDAAASAPKLDKAKTPNPQKDAPVKPVNTNAVKPEPVHTPGASVKGSASVSSEASVER